MEKDGEPDSGRYVTEKFKEKYLNLAGKLTNNDYTDKNAVLYNDLQDMVILNKRLNRFKPIKYGGANFLKRLVNHMLKGRDYNNFKNKYLLTNAIMAALLERLRVVVKLKNNIRVVKLGPPSYEKVVNTDSSDGNNDDDPPPNYVDDNGNNDDDPPPNYVDLFGSANGNDEQRTEIRRLF